MKDALLVLLGILLYYLVKVVTELVEKTINKRYYGLHENRWVAITDKASYRLMTSPSGEPKLIRTPFSSGIGKRVMIDYLATTQAGRVKNHIDMHIMEEIRHEISKDYSEIIVAEKSFM